MDNITGTDPSVISRIFRHFITPSKDETELKGGIISAMNHVDGLDICRTTNVEKDSNGQSLLVSVEELSNLRARIGTEVRPGAGGSLYAMAGFRNAFGRAEKVNASLRWEQSGSSLPNFSFSILNPLFGEYWNQKEGSIPPFITLSNLQTEVSHSKADKTGLSSYLETAFSTILSLSGSFSSDSEHKVGFSTSLIELVAADAASPSVARHCIDNPLNLKVSAFHEFSSHKLHQTNVSKYIKAKSEAKLHLESECAGGAISTVQHARTKIDGLLNTSLEHISGWKLGLVLASTAGILVPFGNTLISDKFHIGGPGQVRGFNRDSIGPQDHGDATGTSQTGILGPFNLGQNAQGGRKVDFLGGDVVMAGSARLVLTPAFLSSKLTAHAFANAGQCIEYKDLLNGELMENWKSSIGAGLIVKLGDSGNLEFNYCYPLQLNETDRFRRFQVGIATDLL